MHFQKVRGRGLPSLCWGRLRKNIERFEERLDFISVRQNQSPTDLAMRITLPKKFTILTRKLMQMPGSFLVVKPYLKSDLDPKTPTLWKSWYLIKKDTTARNLVQAKTRKGLVSWVQKIYSFIVLTDIIAPRIGGIIRRHPSRGYKGN